MPKCAKNTNNEKSPPEVTFKIRSKEQEIGKELLEGMPFEVVKLQQVSKYHFSNQSIQI